MSMKPPPPLKMAKSPTPPNPYSTTTPLPPTPTYERQIAHAAEIKFINDRYVTPVTIEFGSSDSDNSVNLPVKHRELFVALRLSTHLSPSPSMTKPPTNRDNTPWGRNAQNCLRLLQIRNHVSLAFCSS